jgi:hypothetical protein
MGGLITSNVILSDCVIEKITELELYLKNTLKFSKEAAKKRTDRMGDFLESLDAIAVYPLCRFLRWRVLGYHCVVFEKDWVFAYEILADGIIVQDMSHTSILVE